jgi:hypothetical protein
MIIINKIMFLIKSLFIQQLIIFKNLLFIPYASAYINNGN